MMLGHALVEAAAAGPPPIAEPPPRRLVVHDYGGHAFPIQLSRALAARGQPVLHLYCADIESPRGPLAPAPGDPDGLVIAPVRIGNGIEKYSLLRRLVQDTAYGRAAGRRIAAFRPEVVLSCNAPPAVQPHLVAAARRAGAGFVAWQQDIYALGMEHALRHRAWPLRRAAAKLVEAMEFGSIRAADALVVIADDFVDTLAERGVSHPRTFVVENWAPRGEIVPMAKDNPWSRRHGLADKRVFLCAGTLGLKHDPGFLADLARAYGGEADVRVVVASQGLGRRALEEAKAREGLGNLVLLDFQPYEALSAMLAAADVAVALLEPFAGPLSVPSKVLSYFCAGRPILAAIPVANQAARLIVREGAGLVVEPGDRDGFLAGARRLMGDEALRQRCAAAQRRHVEAAFDIDRIARRFQGILAAAEPRS